MNNELLRKISKRIFISCLLFVFEIFFLYSQQELPLTDRLTEQIKYLASDELEGREAGTKCNVMAAEYIESFFQKYHLIPFNNSYLEEFSFETGVTLGKNNKVDFNVFVIKPGLTKAQTKPVLKTWDLNTDWKPVSFSENGSFTGEMVFAGFGISAKDIDYDDYAGIDVKDKAVIVLVDSAIGKPKIEKFTPYSSLRYKATNARDHGAKAIIFIKTMSDSANNFLPLKMERNFRYTGIIAIQANRTAIAKFFPHEHLLYPTELSIAKKMKPESFELQNSEIIINVELNTVKKDIPNVVGYVKGTDPALSNEYIVVGSHLDHLGWGNEFSLYRGKTPMIHHGADDNASGCAGVIELAKRISEKPLRRPVIFASFNAEEYGLLGSANFVEHPPISIKDMVFMLNLDMIGRLKDNKLNVQGIGTSSNFSKLVDSIAILDSLELTKTADGFSPSDNASFYGAGVPTLFLFTFLHGDYHRPTDTWDKINYPGEAKVIDYGEMILRTIGNSDKKPDFLKVVVPQDTSKHGNETSGYGSVWFGIVPNFEDNPNGMRISGTSAGSPAEKAGLQADDIITKYGDKSIKNLYDFTYALRDSKPGQIVKVVVLRKGKELTLDVKLVRR